MKFILLVYILLERLQTADREKATRLYSKQSDFHRDFRELEDLDSKAAEELKMEST